MIQRLLDFLRTRRIAYQRTFLVEGALAPYAEEVLKDLARFCRANDTTFHKDARAHAVLEGRREVWLRIQRHLNLTDEQLYRLHAPVPLSIKEQSDD